MFTVTTTIFSISCWLGLTTLIIISCDVFYVDWDSQHHHCCMLTRTHNADYNIMQYISCWPGPTTLLHVDSHSQHYLWYHASEHWPYFHNIWFMLTGNQSIQQIYVDWDLDILLAEYYMLSWTYQTFFMSPNLPRFAIQSLEADPYGKGSLFVFKLLIGVSMGRLFCPSFKAVDFAFLLKRFA